MKKFLITLALILSGSAAVIAGPYYTDTQKHEIARSQIGTSLSLTRKVFLAGSRMGAIERRIARAYGNRQWRCETRKQAGVLIAKCATSARLKSWVYQINSGNNSPRTFVLLPRGTAGIVAPVYLDAGWYKWY
ncbi:MAG: hypothetical protein ACI92I_000803 [Acidimicrobiales bacterium]|jgi:hypothetical protein